MYNNQAITQNNQLISLFQQGNYAILKNKLTKILKSSPDNGFCLKLLGTTLLLEGKYDESLPVLQRALSYSPLDASIHTNLGYINYELGNLMDSEKHYRYAIEIKPDFAIAHNNLGNLLRDIGRIEEANACFKTAINVNPHLAEALYNLGDSLQLSGHLEEAEIYYRRALAVKPDYADAHSKLGNIFKEQGHLDEALACWRLSLKYGDWKQAIYRLSNPLVIASDLVSSCKNSAYDISDDDLHISSIIKSLPPLEDSFRELYEVKNISCQLVHNKIHSAGSESKTSKKLNIILIYPPLWQIPSPDLELSSGMPFGPPHNAGDQPILTTELRTITQGLLSVAAQAIDAGHNVKVYNLIDCPWSEIVAFIAQTSADIFGISAYNSNRRGMGALCSLIKKFHPDTHITVGGPFVTTMPVETLKYYRAIDTAIIGEGEETFLELLNCLKINQPPVGIPGTAWRDNDEVMIGTIRPRIVDLDKLSSPFNYYKSNLVMTSRGCPSKCTFCANPELWGSKLRFSSVDTCIDNIRTALSHLTVPYIMIADDTFTAHQQRAIDICNAIVDRNINFIWSCNSRVDAMGDELLRTMRLAGCQEIFIGVESGSQTLLNSMKKGITPDMVLNATLLAKKYGMFVHYFMILMNRGETPETVQQSIDLIKAGKPNSYDFSPLTYYPGTEEWKFLCKEQGLSSDIFFLNDFSELSVARKRSKEIETAFQYIHCEVGNINGYEYTIQEREDILERLPNLPIAYLELSNAYFRAGMLDKADEALTHAEQLGFPIENILMNQRACICVLRKKYDLALCCLEKAFQSNPDQIVTRNFNNMQTWMNSSNKQQDRPVMLIDSVRAQDYMLT